MAPFGAPAAIERQEGLFSSPMGMSPIMPFRRRRRSRRPRRRRRFRGRRMRRTRRLVLDPERKVGDINQSQESSDQGLINFVNNIAGGNENTQRIGIQHVNLSSLLTANVDINGGIVPTNVKCWLVWDKSPNGLQMTFAQLLQSVGAATTSARNLQFSLRFRVLWSRSITLDIFNQNKRFKVFKRMRLKSRWLSPVNGIANLQTGALYFLHISDIDALDNPPIVDFSHRLRFVG